MPESESQGGPYRGIGYANVPAIVGILCTDSKGNIDVDMYKAITRDFYLDELLDLWEMREVATSWSRAAQANADLKAKESKRHR